MEQLITYSELCKTLNRNYKTIWAWVKQGKFPDPVKIHGRTVGWKQSDIDAWFAQNS
ncbi:helix-turn-helix transcriptional regulator [Vibrio breoganii]|uniref:helix-turn-helix transcriptional regulator n=1 Tax=Vibrio breoganii TaxID=553239 RepID=UPI000C84B557|nr:AlpA family phage regulatory protein [Vibrio breoganii]